MLKVKYCVASYADSRIKCESFCILTQFYSGTGGIYMYIQESIYADR